MARPARWPAVVLASALVSGCGAAPLKAMATAPLASTSTLTASASPAPPSPTPTPAPAPSVDAAAAWADKYCKVMDVLGAGALRKARADPNSSHVELDLLVDEISSFLVTLNKVIPALKALGPSPTSSGNAAVTHMMPTLIAYRNAYAKIEKNLDAYDPSDPDPDEIDRATAPLNSLTDLPDPRQPLKADPELSSAAKKLASCKKLYAINW